MALAVVNANQTTVRAQSPGHVDVISPGQFFFPAENQIKDSALRLENKPRTDLHYTETNKSEVRKGEETKSEYNNARGAIHISFDYKVLVSSTGPLAGNAGLFTTLEQTQTSLSINSLIIIFEWIFTARPYLSFSP